MESTRQTQIWMDGDACPADVKEILYRAAKKRQVNLTVVANQPIRVPSSEFIKTILVGGGANVADQRIVELLLPGDLVVTADIPLAAAAIDKKAIALNPRGELYTHENIGERLAFRNLLDELRGGGLVTGGPAEFGSKHKQAFANQLDKWFAKRKS